MQGKICKGVAPHAWVPILGGRSRRLAGRAFVQLAAGLLFLNFAACGKKIVLIKQGILDQTDAVMVKDGLATPIILFDGLVAAYPHSRSFKLMATQLCTAYGTLLAKDGEPERAAAIFAKGMKYGSDNLADLSRNFARVRDRPYDVFITCLPEFKKKKQVPYLFHFAQAWTLWIGADGSQQAIAEVPKVRALIERILEIDESYYYGMAHCLMGVLDTSRPESLGGEPEKGKAHFETALRLGRGQTLFIPVVYAEKYCRLVYDRALHDKLLNEVANADLAALPPELTLINTLAKQRAAHLLTSAGDYF